MKRYTLASQTDTQLVLREQAGTRRLMGALLLFIASIIALVLGADWWDMLQGEAPLRPVYLALAGITLAFATGGSLLIADRQRRLQATSYVFDNTLGAFVVKITTRRQDEAFAVAYAEIAAVSVRRVRRSVNNSNSSTTRRRYYYVYVTYLLMQDGSLRDLCGFGTQEGKAKALAERITAFIHKEAPFTGKNPTTVAPEVATLSSQAWPRELRWRNNALPQILSALPLIVGIGSVAAGIILTARQVGRPGDNLSFYIACGFFIFFFLVLAFILRHTLFKQAFGTYAIQVGRQEVTFGQYFGGQFRALRSLPREEVFAAYLHNYSSDNALTDELGIASYAAMASMLSLYDTPGIENSIQGIYPRLDAEIAKLQQQGLWQKAGNWWRSLRKEKLTCKPLKATAVDKLILHRWLQHQLKQD
ncbi:MAG: hypothetical protein KF690_06580 [Bacteroidetes bacterium]|nr:hypothetical protein [Bacteroidota bacterium]